MFIISFKGANNDRIGGEYDLLLSYVFQQRAFPDTLGFKQMDDIINGSSVTFSTDIQSSICINRGSGQNADALNVSLGVITAHTSHGWRPLFELIL